jgi:hypothetical protein
MSDLPQWLVVFGVVQLVATGTIVSAGGYLLFWCWNSPLVVARGRLLTVIVFLGSTICAVEISGLVLFGTDFQVLWLKYAVPQGISFIALPYFIKAYILVFKYEISKYVGKLISSPSSKRGSITEMLEMRGHASWYVRNKWLVESPWPSLVIFLIIAFLVLITPTIASPFANEQNPVPENNAFVGYFLGMIVYCAFLFFKLSNRKDDKWGIRKELKYMTVTSLAMIADWILFAFFLREVAPAVLIMFIVMWLGFVLLLNFSILQPLLEARRQLKSDRVRLSEESSAKSNVDYQLPSGPAPLKLYLEDSRCYQAFYKHVQGEFSLENLAFWEMCQRFRKMSREYQMKKSPEVASMLISLTEVIFHDYIAVEGTSAVNLPAKIRGKVTENYKDFCIGVGIPENRPVVRTSRGNSFATLKNRHSRHSSEVATTTTVSVAAVPLEVKTNFSSDIEDRFLNMFEEAQNDILLMMERDSYARFRKTPEYQETIQYVKEEYFIIEQVKQEAIGVVQTSEVRDLGSIDAPLSPSARDRAQSNDSAVLNALPKW